MVDTELIEKGFGIAAIGIGSSIALGAMQDLVKKPKKGKTIKMFKPIKIKW